MSEDAGSVAKGAANGFARGFMGCFGVLAAVLVVGFGLLVWNAQLSADLTAKGYQSARSEDYESLCSTALVSAQGAAPALDAFPADVETHVEQDPGPPPRIQCAYTGKGGHVIAVTFRAVCGDWRENRCVQITTAILDGRVILADADVRRAMSGGHHRRHHRHRAG